MQRCAHRAAVCATSFNTWFLELLAAAGGEAVNSSTHHYIPRTWRANGTAPRVQMQADMKDDFTTLPTGALGWTCGGAGGPPKPLPGNDQACVNSAMSFLGNGWQRTDGHGTLIGSYSVRGDNTPYKQVFAHQDMQHVARVLVNANTATALRTLP